MLMLDGLLKMVERFQREILGYPIPDAPSRLKPKRVNARYDHLIEEAQEFRESMTLADQADALIDSIYVALGGLVEMGLLPGPLFEEVHEANMRKVRGTVDKRKNHEGYDAVKPGGWKPADFTPYLTITKADVTDMLSRRDLDRRFARTTDLLTDLAEVSAAGVLKRAMDRTGGMKADDGKMRFSLLLEGMPRGLARVVEILEYGAKKYAPHNWKKVENGLERYKEALERHVVSREGILGVDPESGLRHVAHVACNALFLLEILDGGADA